ncbi:hypothetical protein MKW92_037442 [Papaver armeniacum]|nr:hypothetical protein MKW92_037442 [Papaver armeniacum]
MVSSKSLFLSLIIIFILISFDSVSDNVSIDDIILVGDSRVQQNGLISLTSTSSPSSSGRALYGHPIRFRNHSTNFTASFISKFSFTISPDSSYSPPLFGDGLTFIITSNPEIVGNDFGYMGLWNQTTQEKGFYIAVEFDTSFDPILEDISDNHIGIDINSVMSFASVDSTSMGFDLKNGKRTTVWVEYIDSKKMLKVWLSYTLFGRPVQPFLSSYMDLSTYVEELMFIGFSASNGGGSAKHIVHNVEFETYPPPFNSCISFRTRVKDGCSAGVNDEGRGNGIGPMSTGKLIISASLAAAILVGVAILVDTAILVGAEVLHAICRKVISPDQNGGADQTTADPVIDAPVVLSTNPPDMVDSKTSTSFHFDQVHGILKDTSLLEETREDVVDNLIGLRRKMKNVS